MGWRWDPIATLKIQHDYAKNRFVCKGELRNADLKCDELIPWINHRNACLLLDQNARLKPNTFGIRELNTWTGLKILALTLQCNDHAKPQLSTENTTDRWEKAVSDEAKVRRDYDKLIDQIAMSKLSLPQKITEYRKVLYGFVEELLEKQQWACSNVEAEFTIMRDVYTSLHKKVRPLDKELDDLKTGLNTLYDEFQKWEKTWACGGWYE